MSANNAFSSFTNFEEANGIASAIFVTNDFSRSNMLRRSILSEISTYAIDIVIFNVNTSAREDEILALRMGQCVINNILFEPKSDPMHRYIIDFTGPGTFSTNNIPGIPFTYETPIAELLSGQRIFCEVIVREGRARTHVKWSPVSTIDPIKEVPGGYLIRFKSVGMLATKDILIRGLERIPDAIARPAKNIFFQPLVPNDVPVNTS